MKTTVQSIIHEALAHTFEAGATHALIEAARMDSAKAAKVARALMDPMRSESLRLAQESATAKVARAIMQAAVEVGGEQEAAQGSLS